MRRLHRCQPDVISTACAILRNSVEKDVNFSKDFMKKERQKKDRKKKGKRNKTEILTRSSRWVGGERAGGWGGGGGGQGT